MSLILKKLKSQKPFCWQSCRLDERQPVHQMRQMWRARQRQWLSSSCSQGITHAPLASVSALSVSESFPPVTQVVLLEHSLAAGRVSELPRPVACVVAQKHRLAVEQASHLPQPVSVIAAGSPAYNPVAGLVSERLLPVAAIDTLERRVAVDWSLPTNR